MSMTESEITAKKLAELTRIKDRIRLAYLTEYKPKDPFDASEVRNLVLDDIVSVYDGIEPEDLHG